MNPHASNASKAISRRAAMGRMLFATAGARAWFNVRSQETAPLTVFFYSPESSVNNFSDFKSEFDAFLAPLGGHKFQPFSDRDTFEKQLATSPRGLFLLTSAHYKDLASKVLLDPLLVGRARGKFTQRHQLFSRNLTLDELRSQRITAAATKAHTNKLLNEMFPGRQQLIDTFTIFPVKKEIDALLTAGAGAFNAVVATENGAEKFRETNPKLAQNLKQIGQSRESLLPVLAVSRGADAGVREFAKVFAGMDATEDGSLMLQRLGFEAMRELDAELNRRLLQ